MRVHVCADSQEPKAGSQFLRGQVHSLEAQMRVLHEDLKADITAAP
jgi:hypothetical protein